MRKPQKSSPHISPRVVTLLGILGTLGLIALVVCAALLLLYGCGSDSSSSPSGASPDTSLDTENGLAGSGGGTTPRDPVLGLVGRGMDAGEPFDASTESADGGLVGLADAATEELPDGGVDAGSDASTLDAGTDAGTEPAEQCEPCKVDEDCAPGYLCGYLARDEAKLCLFLDPGIGFECRRDIEPAESLTSVCLATCTSNPIVCVPNLGTTCAQWLVIAGKT